MSRRKKYRLEDLTPPENLGYLGDQEHDIRIMVASLIALLSTMGGLLALVNGWIPAVLALMVAAGLSTFFMLRFTRQDQERQQQWISDTYSLKVTAGELQQLREGKAIQRGTTWWVRDQQPWIIGFKLVKTEAASGFLT